MDLTVRAKDSRSPGYGGGDDPSGLLAEYPLDLSREDRHAVSLLHCFTTSYANGPGANRQWAVILRA